MSMPISEQSAAPFRFESQAERNGLAWRFPAPAFDFHHAKWSDWYLGLPSGSGVNFGTPEVKIAVDSSSFRIPLTAIKEGKVTHSIILEGDGIGVGASVGCGCLS